ncbi:SHOCT domain-containing protein [Flavobacteriaceae bacterium]|nr:SHOCT domain-containing protein [Flavobacteriaceae bacterium]
MELKSRYNRLINLKIILTAFITLVLFQYSAFSQDFYKTKSGVIYKIGDTIQLGQPLSHLGWYSIYSHNSRETYIKNRNMINDEIIIKSIDNSVVPTKFFFDYYNKEFIIEIDDALKNKEVIPQFERELAKKGYSEKSNSKYRLIKELKELLDIGAITQEEFNTEKKKILGQ